MLLRNLYGPFATDRDFDPLPFLKKLFLTIGTAKVATSAEEARELGFLQRQDGISLNRDFLLSDAKARVLGMADSGYEHGDTPGLAVGYSREFKQAGALDMSVPYAAGGLYSTVLDLERWVDALDADALVDAAAMQRFVTPLADTADGGKTGYAYGVSVDHDDGHRVTASEKDRLVQGVMSC